MNRIDRKRLLRHPSRPAFTLVELLVASSLAVILLTVVTGVLYQSIEFAEKVQTRPLLNAKAREMLDMLGDGGFDNSDTGNPLEVTGLHGHDADPPGTFRVNEALTLTGLAPDPEADNDATPPATTQGTITSSTVGTTVVRCNAVDDPIPDCTAAGATVTVDGYLADDPAFYVTDRRVRDSDRGATFDRTVEVTISVMHPLRANRTGFTKTDVADSFRTIFTLNRAE